VFAFQLKILILMMVTVALLMAPPPPLHLFKPDQAEQLRAYSRLPKWVNSPFSFPNYCETCRPPISIPVFWTRKLYGICWNLLSKVAAATLLAYDILITFHEEISHIWRWAHPQDIEYHSHWLFQLSLVGSQGSLHSFKISAYDIPALVYFQ
jgi:Family of unknown function (DUF6533)